MQAEPNQVADNDQLRFALRYENANKLQHNFRLMQKRQEDLRRAGGYRTLLKPLGFRRRAGQPNRSSDVHAVQDVAGRLVIDTAGEVSQTKLVQPVPLDSTKVAFRPYQTGGPRKSTKNGKTYCSALLAF